MFNKSSIFLLIAFFLISCSGNEEINETASRFPVLSYSAEISETLNLDPGDILINEPKEVNFWSQHFLNPLIRRQRQVIDSHLSVEPVSYTQLRPHETG